MAKKKTKYQRDKEKWLRQFRADYKRISRRKNITRSDWERLERRALKQARKGSTPLDEARAAVNRRKRVRAKNPGKRWHQHMAALDRSISEEDHMTGTSKSFYRGKARAHRDSVEALDQKRRFKKGRALRPNPLMMLMENPTAERRRREAYAREYEQSEEGRADRKWEEWLDQREVEARAEFGDQYGKRAIFWPDEDGSLEIHPSKGPRSAIYIKSWSEPFVPNPRRSRKRRQRGPGKWRKLYHQGLMHGSFYPERGPQKDDPNYLRGFEAARKEAEGFYDANPCGGRMRRNAMPVRPYGFFPEVLLGVVESQPGTTDYSKWHNVPESEILALYHLAVNDRLWGSAKKFRAKITRYAAHHGDTVKHAWHKFTASDIGEVLNDARYEVDHSIRIPKRNPCGSRRPRRRRRRRRR